MGLGGGKTVQSQTGTIERLNNWRPENSKIHIFDTLRQSAESDKVKFTRLIKFVKDNPFEIVYSINAGGSLGIRHIPLLPATTEHRFICAKLHYPETIGIEITKRSPAFKDSVVESQKIIKSTDLSKYNITCHAWFFRRSSRAKRHASRWRTI